MNKYKKLPKLVLAIVPLMAAAATITAVGYTATVTPAFAHGCTPGFWKNHLDQLPFSQSATLNTLFGTTLPPALDYTAEQALNAGGGGFNALARHAVAALANSLTIGDYTYSDTQVINFFKDAIDPNIIQIASIPDDNDLETIKDKLDTANNLPTCPF